MSPRIHQLLHIPHGVEQSERVKKITEEFVRGFHFLRNYGLAASFFGSARRDSTHPTYQEAYQLAFRLSKAGFVIITGGGPGIMEAANKGAYDAGGTSAGLNIRLPKGQQTNRYVKEAEAFDYFFIRKVMLAFASEVYIFFPGGFGTLDEFFELTTLVQTKKIGRIPIILVDKAYWQPLVGWIKKSLYQRNKTIGKKDTEIYRLADSADEAFRLIRKMVKKDGRHQWYV